ncbi:predicted protein [Uncinocarpus reesii 1704]|uniref:Uncharacterized protein n=1 Tax=Uncinocarpus reesii (strain UAMH 1704) TaxID=336963 RepID=C4K091_UNCRE|nr:uncharacterized protein UREG_07905 [Uncinocarpus reesii 1704]EEP83040.1 predicted protein [Uncinocarpus reesii 1704]
MSAPPTEPTSSMILAPSAKTETIQPFSVDVVDLTGDSDKDITDVDALNTSRASGPKITTPSAQDNNPGSQAGDLTGMAPAGAGTPSPVVKRERSLTPKPSVVQRANSADSTDSTRTERASPPPPDQVLSERSGSGRLYIRQMRSAVGTDYWSMTFMGELMFSRSEDEAVSPPRGKRRRT